MSIESVVLLAATAWLALCGAAFVYYCATAIWWPRLFQLGVDYHSPRAGPWWWRLLPLHAFIGGCIVVGAGVDDGLLWWTSAAWADRLSDIAGVVGSAAAVGYCTHHGWRFIDEEGRPAAR